MAELKRKLNKYQKKNRKRLQKWYDNINSYDLAVANVASLRPTSGLLPEIIEEAPSLMIHCVRPSEYHVEDTFIIPNNVATKFPEFDLQHLQLPEVLPEDEERMRKYWRTLNNGYTEKEFRDFQAKKHLKYQKLPSTSNIYNKGLKRAHPYIAPRGKLNLMKILREKGYEVGNMYDCAQLVNDLEEIIGGVKVVFGELKPVEGQVLEEVMVLEEICILFDHKARKRILGKRKQSFEEGSVFLFEDFHYRFGG